MTATSKVTALLQPPVQTMAPTGKVMYGSHMPAPPKHYEAHEKLHQTESDSCIPFGLTSKLIGDAAIGTSVTFLMAPFLTIADKAIAQRAAGTHTLLRSCQLSVQTILTNPVGFVRNPAFLYVWAVYAATYTTANSLKTLVEHQEHASTKTAVKSRQGGSSLGTIGVFLGTSAANSGASLMKDRAFAHMFAANTASTAITKQVPTASFGLWMSRDLIGVGSSFVLPDLIAKKLSESNPEADAKRNRYVSQFFVPIATQLVAGPLHLLGLDLFNRPMQDLSWKQVILERSKFMMNGYAAVVGARVARIIPGYGFGGVLNSKFRDGWRDYLVQRDAEERPLQATLSATHGVAASNILTAFDTASI